MKDQPPKQALIPLEEIARQHTLKIRCEAMAKKIKNKTVDDVLDEFRDYYNISNKGLPDGQYIEKERIIDHLEIVYGIKEKSDYDER